MSLLDARVCINIPSEVADAPGILFDDDTVYKRARLAFREHESRERRVLCIVVVVVMSLDIVCMVMTVVVSGGGCQRIEHDASESQC